MIGMELTIGINPEMHVEGPVTIELPPWMHLLPVDERDEASNAPNRSKLAVAAGRHPVGDIVFLTGDGQLWELDGETQERSGLPMFNVEVTPIDHGLTLEYIMTGIDAPFEVAPFEVATSWALERARSIIFFGALSDGPEPKRVRYLDE